jgi:hypothetical protein
LQSLRCIFTKAYIFAFDCLFVRNLLGNTYLGWSWLRMVTYFCIAIIIVKLSLTYYHPFDRKVIAGLLIFGFIVWMVMKSNLIIISILLITASKNVSIRKIIWHCTILTSISILIVLGCALAGIIPNKFEYEHYAFGFTNANLLAFYIIIVALGIEYICSDYLKPTFHCFSIALLIISGLVTGSRACYLVIFALILGNLGIQLSKKKFGREILWEFIFLFLSFGWVFCVINYKNFSFLNKINQLCTGRLEQANYYLSKYGFSLFGHFIPELNGQNHWPWFTIDGAYGDLLVVYGVFACVIFIFIYFCTIRCYRQQGENTKVIVLMAIAFHMLVENAGMIATYDPFLLLVLPAMLECNFKNIITKHFSGLPRRLKHSNHERSKG